MKEMSNAHQARYIKEVYPIKALLAAKYDYRNLATIDISDEGEYHCCSFRNCVVDPLRIMHEFDNYLVEVINSQEKNSK